MSGVFGFEQTFDGILKVGIQENEFDWIINHLFTKHNFIPGTISESKGMNILL